MGDQQRQVTWRVAGGRAVPGPPRRQPAFSDRGDWRPGCRPAHLRTVTMSTGLRGCGQAGAARPGRATQEPGRRRLRLSTAPGWVPLSTCAWPPAPAIAGGLHRWSGGTRRRSPAPGWGRRVRRWGGCAAGPAGRCWVGCCPCRCGARAWGILSGTTHGVRALPRRPGPGVQEHGLVGTRVRPLRRGAPDDGAGVAGRHPGRRAGVAASA